MIETPIDGSPGATPPPSLVGDATSYEKLQGDKLRAERNAYALLDALAPDLVTGKRDEILTRALSKLSPGDLQSGQIGTAALGEIIGAVETAKGNTAFNWSAATPEQIKTYLLGKGVDPALAALRAGIPARGNSDGGGRDLSGGEGAKTMGASVRSNDYQMILGLSSAESLQRLSSGNWGNTAASMPFAKAGINFGTVDYLRKYDKSFTGKDVLKAAGDVKQLGFDVNDHRMMRDQALIRHYDYDPDGTFKSEKKFNEEIKGDENLHELWRKRAACTDPGQQKVLDAQIAAAKDEHKKSSGVHDRLADPKRSPQAKKGLDDATEKMFETERAHALQHGLKHSRALTPQQPDNRRSELGNKPAGDRAKTEIAQKGSAKPMTKVASNADDVFGKADEPETSAPSKAAEKPKPTKVAAKGSSPSVG